MPLQVVDDVPFLGRETEQAHLLAQLKQTPDSMLLLLGPCSSGKTRLLKEVVLSDELDMPGDDDFGETPVSLFSGHMALSHASAHTHMLESYLNPRPKLTPLTMVESRMNAIITAYSHVLTARKEALGSPAVICIDHADVLMNWYEGHSTTQTDLLGACVIGHLCSMQIIEEEPRARNIKQLLSALADRQ